MHHCESQLLDEVGPLMTELTTNNEYYEVINPTVSYLGKTYGNWVSDWTNWFYSIDPDKHNGGPVVFLRNLPFTSTPSNGLDYEPMIMIGNDKLEIFDDQAVLIPIITANYVATEQWNSNNTDTFLRGMVRSHLLGGDYPPNNDQLTIDGVPLQVNLNEYLIETPIFTIFLPNIEYGRSLKDYMEEPLPSGTFNCVTAGYFLLVKLTIGLHVIHSYARGLRTEQGEFYSELLYQINVSSREGRPSAPGTGLLPFKLTNKLMTKLKEKLKDGEIDQGQYEILKNIIESARQKLSRRILHSKGES